MRKIKIYAVVSIEGYACDRDGNFDWMIENNLPVVSDYGIRYYLECIGLVVMSRDFYSIMVACELRHHYFDIPCLISRKGMEGPVHDLCEVEYVDAGEGYAPVVERVRRIRDTPGGDIWIAGGMDLIKAFFDAGLIDEIHLTQLPLSIGSGIRLLPASFREGDWRVVHSNRDKHGVIKIIYRSSVLFERHKVN